MPIVPGELQQISTDVPNLPREHVTAADATGDALAGVGNGVAKNALGIMDHIKEAEANDASSTATYQAKLDATEKLTKLNLEHPTGYMTNDDGTDMVNDDGTRRTTSQEYRDWANERFQSDQLAMPTVLAQNKYQTQAQPFFETSLQKARNDELSARVGTFSRGLDDRLKGDLNQLSNVPNVRDAYDKLDDRRLDVMQQSKLIGAASAHETVQEIQKKIPQSLMGGLITGVMKADQLGSGLHNASIDFAQSVLRGDDPDSKARQAGGRETISDLMDPNEKNAFNQRLEGMRDAAKALDKNDINQQIKDSVAQAKADPSYRFNIDELVNKINSKYDPNDPEGGNGNYSQYEHAQKLGELFVTARIQPVINSPDTLLASPARQAEIQKNIIAQVHDDQRSYFQGKDADLWKQSGGEVIAEAQKRLTDEFQQRNELAKSDFATFATADSRVKALTANFNTSDLASIQQTAQILGSRNKIINDQGLAYFGHKNDPNAKLLSNDEAKNITAQFKSDTNVYTDVSKTMTTLFKSDPANYQKMMGQMIDHDGLDGGYRLALGLAGKDPVLQTEVVRAIKDAPKIQAAAKGALETDGITESEVNQSVHNLGGAYFTSLTGNMDSTAAVQARIDMEKAVTTEALLQYGRGGGKKQGGMDFQTAAQNAVQSFLVNQWKVTSAGGGAPDPAKLLRGKSVGDLYSPNVPGVQPGIRHTYTVPADLPKPQQDAVTANGNYLLNGGNLEKMGGMVPATPQVPTVLTDKGKASWEADWKSQFWKQVEQTGSMKPTPDHQGYNFFYFDKTYGHQMPVMSTQKDRNGNPIKLYMPLNKMTQPLDPHAHDEPINNNLNSFGIPNSSVRRGR